MSRRYKSRDRVPLPPPDAHELTTVCDYCVVGCGYRGWIWPDGTEGGPRANENALGVDFPTAPLSGYWASPNQHTRVIRNGKSHHLLLIPDPRADVVNRQGNHSIRGGAIAQKCFSADRLTRDRLRSPLLRVKGTLTPVSWEDAFSVMAGVSKHVLATWGEMAWGMKTYSYQFFENTYAISKLAFGTIQTPAYAPHDKPGPGNDTAGLDDSGIIPFSASYEDWSRADVIFISGTDPYETKTVLFTEWMMKGVPKKLIFAVPRRTTGVAWAESQGGLWLDVIPGTDTILHLALGRVILERGWQDREWLASHIASRWEIDAGFGRGTRDTPWQWRTTWGKLGTDLAGYEEWLLSLPQAELPEAAAITGVPEEKILRAAELLAKPRDGTRPRASFAFEKGNYWSNNYLNTASFAALGLLCGSGSRPGRVISRLGGHQRGWMGAAPYPLGRSPEKYPGRRRKEIDLDRWVEAGHLRFAWVIGTSWINSMAASDELARTFRRLTRQNPHQVERADPSHAADTLKQRCDSGGMAVVVQDIYLPSPIGSEFADLVLPAATWGEDDFTRANGERRLRLYPRFYDPPGEAKPDWWILSRFAQKMGYRDFEWESSNQVFEEAARFGRDGTLNYYPLVVRARREGRPAHELLREMGTTGIQCPVRMLEDGSLAGTKRLHDETLDPGPPVGPTTHKKWLTQFNTHTGKAVLHKTPWELFADFYERITPGDGELWVTNGRINEVWQSAFDDLRRPYIMERWPSNFVEIHPQDAAPRGIESGDEVRIWSDDVLVQTGGFVGVDPDDLSFRGLEKAGHIRVGRGEFRAVALLTPDIRRGVLFTHFLWPGSPANSVVHRVPDPITNRYRFKLGKGRLEKVGESPYKHSLDQMSLKPRTAGFEV